VGLFPDLKDCFLCVIEGIKTLSLAYGASFSERKDDRSFSLKNHPKNEKVYWPGFEIILINEVLKSQMRIFGRDDFFLEGEQNRIDAKKQVIEEFLNFFP